MQIYTKFSNYPDIYKDKHPDIRQDGQTNKNPRTRFIGNIQTRCYAATKSIMPKKYNFLFLVGLSAKNYISTNSVFEESLNSFLNVST